MHTDCMLPRHGVSVRECVLFVFGLTATRDVDSMLGQCRPSVCDADQNIIGSLSTDFGLLLAPDTKRWPNAGFMLAHRLRR